MNFNSIGASNSRNYAAAAKSAVDAQDKAFSIARKTGPDYAMLSKTAMDNASAEKRMAMKAEASVTQAGIRAVGNVKQTQLKTQTDLKLSKMKAKQRMAGGVAALGKIAGAGYLAFKDNTKGREYPTADTSSIYEDYKSTRDKLLQERKSQRTTYKPTGSSVSSDTGGTAGKASGADGTLVSSAQALDAGKGTAGKGGKYTIQQMTDFAIKGGFSSENAPIMAAISMGESGGNAGIDTVQSGLDPTKSNEYSIGLSQINVQAHADKLNRRGWTEEDLRDPVKNMTIAKEVYDEVGSFNPWSVYKKGLHNQYLN